MRLYQCAPGTIIGRSGLFSASRSSAVTDIASAGSKRPAQSEVGVSKEEAELAYFPPDSSDAQGIEEAEDLVRMLQSGCEASRETGGAFEYAAPVVELAPAKRYAHLLQGYFAHEACPGVAAGHGGSFCIPDWDEEKNCVSGSRMNALLSDINTIRRLILCALLVCCSFNKLTSR
jgi:hypothetical protein